MTTNTEQNTIASNLIWIEIVRGLAIIGVFFDNWRLNTGVVNPISLFSGPIVQAFFILSGFGLYLGYLNGRENWDWKKWSWRRFTKIFVPYILIVLFSFALGIFGSYFFTHVNKEFSWSSLLVYLTLLHNFYPEQWGYWNSPLWFMPVIAGLYLSFPLLIKLFERGGAKIFMILTFLVTNGAITIAILWLGGRGHHGYDIFLYWIFSFSVGMVLAYLRQTHPEKFHNLLIGIKPFLVGLGLYAFSWVLRSYVPHGAEFNDVFTSIGVFLLLLNIAWFMHLYLPFSVGAAKLLSKESFTMYLIHYPILAYLIPRSFISRQPIISIIQVLLFVGVVYIIAYLFSKPLDKLSSSIYHFFYPPYQRPKGQVEQPTT